MSFHTLGWTLLVASFSGANVLPSFPLDDPATLLLDRLEGTSGCRLPVRRPWPGEEVLACVDSLLASPQVTAADKARLEPLRHRLDLRDSASPAGLVSWADGADRLSLDVGASAYAHSIDRTIAIGPTLSDSLDQDRLVGLRVRPRVDVLLGSDLALWARPHQLVEVSDQRRWAKLTDPSHGVYQTALFAKTEEVGKARTSDWIEGAVELESRLGRFSGGLTPLEWGDLPLEPLMLSGRTASILNLQTTKRIGPLEATLLGGKLIGDSWDERRYLYAHRYAYNGSSLRLGWSEMILSVDHDLQPLYLVPVFPYVFTEHYLGDPDNKQMDFDASWRVRPDLELSAELFLDDLQNYFGFLSDGWGNKWALGIGFKGSGWTGEGSLDRLQFTRVEPWTGTASSSILPGASGNAPVHFGVALGSQAGPNSATLAWGHSQDVSERWTWNAGFSATWKGTDLGSSVLDRNWRDSSGTWVVAEPLKKWLDGDLIDRQELSVGLQWRCAPAWRLDGSVGIARESVPTKSVAWRPSVALGASWRE
jgi:hypothetical protein